MFSEYLSLRSKLLLNCVEKPLPWRLQIRFFFLSSLKNIFLCLLAISVQSTIKFRQIITIDDKIKDEKVQYDINRETPKIFALSSGKIDKYEFLTNEEIYH